MANTVYDVIIIGAGASGLVCAVECARQGRSVLVLEKEALAARKILASGNGRCNLTNANVSAAYYNGDAKLAEQTISRFSFQDCLDYFHQIGVLTLQEEAGRVFPATGKATAVVEALKLALEEAGGLLQTNCEVVKIKKTDLFTLHIQTGESFTAKACVLACGSCAYPQIGGTQSGYQLAKSFGHHITPLTPALGALNLKEKAAARLAGIRFQVKVNVQLKNQLIDSSHGEVLFTNYGISGPAILSISGNAARQMAEGEVTLTLNFLPEMTDLKSFFYSRLKTFGHRKPKDFFAGLLHETLANLLIDFAGVRKNLVMNEQTPNTLDRIISTVQAWPFTVLSARPWNEAMVTAGGVNTAEINYNTLESLYCPCLFLAGELLNVDGKSGGFNLHFAWGSGRTAALGVGGLAIW